jgi:hypothetical protein
VLSAVLHELRCGPYWFPTLSSLFTLNRFIRENGDVAVRDFGTVSPRARCPPRTRTAEATARSSSAAS